MKNSHLDRTPQYQKIVLKTWIKPPLFSIIQENEGNEKNPIKAEEFQIVLESHTLNTDQLREVLAGWVSEYEAKLNGNNDKQLKFFMYTPQGDVTNEYYDPSSNYSEFKFESGKVSHFHHQESLAELFERQTRTETFADWVWHFSCWKYVLQSQLHQKPTVCFL